MKQIVQVLDVARDNIEQHEIGKKVGVVDEDASSDSERDDDSDSSTDDDDGSDEEKSVKPGTHREKTGEELDGRGITNGWADGIRSYKRDRKSTHRRHRGIMQWKVSCGDTGRLR